jgi:hypothetical protein
MEGNKLYSFKKNYSTSNLLDIEELYKNPNREKYGYLWEDLYTRIILQTSSYRKNYKLTGFYINNPDDYESVIGIINRNFCLSVTANYNKWFSMYEFDNPGQSIWMDFFSIVNKYNRTIYHPLKKYILENKPNRLWIQISDYKITRKDPIYDRFLCGNESIEIDISENKCISSDLWEDSIKDGELKNPGELVFSGFINNFVECAKYIPNEITNKIKDSGAKTNIDLSYLGFY